MISLSTPAAGPATAVRDARLRPVPWRKLAWVIWRQHRTALAGVAVLFAGLSAYLLIQGLQIHQAYAPVAACHPASSIGCGDILSEFNDAYWAGAEVMAAVLQVIPALIGAFLGAPALARELETGTYRYSWTQGFQRTRWTTGKLAALAVLITAVAGAFSLLFSWYYQPFITDGQQSWISPPVFDLHGIGYAAWTLAAFAIGALAGMLIRRVVPAMATTLAVYAGLAIAVPTFLRGHYLAPLTVKSLHVNNGSVWVLSQWYTDPSGQRLDQATVVQFLHYYQGDYLVKHGFTQWTSYQPAVRFWPFQLIEGGWLLALSLLLIAGTVWLVRHRAA